MEYQISSKAKRTIIATVAIGLILFIVGAIMDSGSEQFKTRLLSNFLIDGFFFFAIALGALFFLALQYATETAWYVTIKRVIEGVASYLIVGIGILLAVFLVLTFTDGGGIVEDGHHVGHVYQWMDPVFSTEGSDHYDKLIANKAPFLTKPFFWVMTLLYMVVYYLFWRGFRKRSLNEDIEGGTDIHFKNYKRGAIFLVFFAVFSSTSSWHWLMSIDAHWFSTLFGWYTFGGMWCTAMTTIMLLLIYLKKNGYLKQVNDHHIHDVGKWIFATSFLWSYLFFSQFMLYWYADIPEEVIYYVQRIEQYPYIFWGMFIINFAIPMLILMSREAKRNPGILMFVCLVIIIGHWADVYMLVTPGSMGEFGTIGILEVGLFLTFAGVFTYVVLNALTKAPLMPKNHPFLDESKHHEI